MRRLVDFRMRACLTGAELAEVLREKFPKIDKTVISKCERPEMYGVVLCKEAWDLVRKKYPDVFSGRAGGSKADRHKQTHRISARLTAAQISMLQQRLKSSGRTVQDFLAAAVEKELREGDET